MNMLNGVDADRLSLPSSKVRMLFSSTKTETTNEHLFFKKQSSREFIIQL